MWIKINSGKEMVTITYFVTSFTLVWIKMARPQFSKAVLNVTSFTLVWIKMSASSVMFGNSEVTSFTLVWIKMETSHVIASSSACVTSFTLVWIKIRLWLGVPRSRDSHELHARVD